MERVEDSNPARQDGRVDSTSDLARLRDEWFEVEDDIPFWEYAGITEDQYREWIVTEEARR